MLSLLKWIAKPEIQFPSFGISGNYTLLLKKMGPWHLLDELHHTLQTPDANMQEEKKLAIYSWGGCLLISVCEEIQGYQA